MSKAGKFFLGAHCRSLFGTAAASIRVFIINIVFAAYSALDLRKTRIDILFGCGAYQATKVQGIVIDVVVRFFPSPIIACTTTGIIGWWCWWWWWWWCW